MQRPRLGAERGHSEHPLRDTAVSSPTELTEGEFEKFRKHIYRVSGIQIPATKRVLVSNRLRRRLRATGISTYAAYYAMLTARTTAAEAEAPKFLDEITTNETYFFRDPHHFEWVASQFLPELIARTRAGKRRRLLRVWSAAASTGEELYSLALKLQEFKADLLGWKITLLGTDLSPAALDAARAGSYDERSLRLVPVELRRLYFDQDAANGQRSTIKPEIRAAVTWKPHNLLLPLREDPFDLIFIKNVLIYFDTASKQIAVKHLLDRLARGGCLVVGPTEGIHNMLGELRREHTWAYRRGESDVGI